jgi:hypothetical protein
MYNTPAAIDPSTIWWALIIGLLVQALITYGCIRLALRDHHIWVEDRGVKAEQAAKRATERASDTTIWGAASD